MIPYFAIYTFLPLVLLKMGVGEEDTTSDGLLNLFLLAGSLAGLWLVAKATRRGLTIWSFVVLIAALTPMALWPDAPTALLFPLFLLFTFTMSAAVNLDQVYPPELLRRWTDGRGNTPKSEYPWFSGRHMLAERHAERGRRTRRSA